MKKSLQDYVTEVKSGEFPDEIHMSHADLSDLN